MNPESEIYFSDMAYGRMLTRKVNINDGKESIITDAMFREQNAMDE